MIGGRIVRSVVNSKQRGELKDGSIESLLGSELE